MTFFLQSLIRTKNIQKCRGFKFGVENIYHVKDNDKSNYFIILVINKCYIKYQYIFVVKCLHTLMSMNVMWFGDHRFLYTSKLNQQELVELILRFVYFLSRLWRGLVKPTGTVKSTAALIKRSEPMNLFEPVYKSCYVFIVAILLFMLVPSRAATNNYFCN